MEYSFLSKIDRSSSLFGECVKAITEQGSGWNEEKINDFLDIFQYDCFIASTDEKLISMIAFREDSILSKIEAFFLFVVPEKREQGIASQIMSLFLTWAKKKGFTTAQVGKGNSSAGVKVLEKIKSLPVILAEKIEITPENGLVILNQS